MVQNTDLTPGTCPQCSGRRVQYVVHRNPVGERVMLPVKCGLCGGEGTLNVMDEVGFPKPPPPVVPKADPLPVELWLIAVPLGLFILFFLFLWL